MSDYKITHVLITQTPNGIKPGDVLESKVTEGYEVLSVNQIEDDVVLTVRTINGQTGRPFELRFPRKANIRVYVKY